MAFAGLFRAASQTADYARTRPTYPSAMFEALFRFSQLPVGPGTLAVDVATGSGQAIRPLAARFERVLGLDVSEAQLRHAPALPNVEYQVGDAHAMPLADGSADLVLVAQALHWLDRPRFYREAARVLKPHGTLAACTYDHGVLQLAAQPSPSSPASSSTSTASTPLPAVAAAGGDSSPLGRELQQAWVQLHSGVLGPFWEGPRAIVDAHYEGIEPMSPHFRHTAREALPMVHEVGPLSSLVAFVRSWSAYTTWARQRQGQQQQQADVAEEFGDRLRSLLARHGVRGQAPGGAAGQEAGPAAEPQFRITRRLTLLMSRGPLPRQ